MTPSPFARREKNLNASMNVVPYIDVMLVLLVIFMVTTPMLTTGVNVDLPNANAENLGVGQQMPAVVSMQSDGSLFLNTNATDDVPVSEMELVETLLRLQAESQASGQGDISVIINADATNQYGMIVQLMANLKEAGVRKVGLLTEPAT